MSLQPKRFVQKEWILTLCLYSVLEESIPSLRAFMNKKIDSEVYLDESNHNVTDGLTQRWTFLLSKLLHAISTESHPIAVSFEDIHWADNDALGEDDIRCILFRLFDLTVYFNSFQTLYKR